MQNENMQNAEQGKDEIEILVDGQGLAEIEALRIPVGSIASEFVTAEAVKSGFSGEQIDPVSETENQVTILKETVVENETSHDNKDAEISVELFSDAEHRRQYFRAAKTVLLLEVLEEGARKLDVKLLPNLQAPLDLLRGVYRDHQLGIPLNLELMLAEFLKQEPVTHHFAIELVLAIQINTRWRVAPKDEMTPEAILELADLPPAEYSLYYPSDSTEPLPPDTPIKLHRGQRFEAQRDGKYGQEDGCEHIEG